MQIYISEVIANPLGNDDENLNQETVLIEINADTDRDLSGFTLLYSNAQTYNFPDLVSSVPPQSTLQIHSGKEKSSSEEDSKTRFNLFVGSTTSLLANDGMELTLQDSAGNVVDQISYPGLEPGEVYARPEKN